MQDRQATYFSQRESGIPLIGDLPWGSHFCQFYQTREDLLEILVPYWQAGLRNNEFCLWVLDGRPEVEEANRALQEAVPRFEEYARRGQMEIVSRDQWPAGTGPFDSAVVSRLDKAISRGFDGLRLACNPLPQEATGPGARDTADALCRYNVLAVFAYPRDQFDAVGLMAVVRNHRLALVKNAGRWEVIESSEAQSVKEALRRSEEKLHSVFANMSEGYAYHRIVLDERGHPCDFVFLEVNQAFERLTGLRREDLIGRRVTQALPGIEEDDADWIGTYGTVALTGKPVQFESYSQLLRKWYAVSAFSPHQGFFAVTFRDITAHKATEQAIREANQRLQDQAEELQAQAEELQTQAEELATANEELREHEQALQESEHRVRAKLDAILTPEGDIGTLDLADMIDAPGVQALMDDLYELARMPMSIIDLEGKILVGVGWQRICTDFHRVHPETCRHCIESDTQLSAGLAPGEVKLYKCKNHMWDIATPIFIGGRHVGNVFSGQFLFEGEPIDYERFRAQARRYGFDEAQYIAALEAVPRLTRAAVDTGMAFFKKLAHMLSQLSYGNIQLARSLSEHDRLAASLRENEERLKRAQAIAHLGSWELDLSKNELTWSDEVYRIFGLQPQESGATYEAFLERVHPEDRAAVDAAYSSSVRERRDTYEIEHRVICRNTGEIRHVHEKCQHVRDAAGNIVRSAGMVHDITEHKQAQEALQKAHDELEMRVEERTAELRRTTELLRAERQRFEDLLEMLPAYAILLTPDYHVAYTNRTFREWFGEDHGRKCHEFLFGRPEPCETCETYTVLKTGQPHFWEWTGPNGRDYDIYDYPFTDTDSAPLIMEIGVDVTAHKQAQQALQSASLYSRSLLEASLDPLVTISPEGKITDVNEATIEVTGVPRSELVGSDFCDYFTEPAQAREGYQKVISDGYVRDYPLTIRHASGRTTDVLYNATVYRNQEGRVEGVFAAARDITERKCVEAELAEHREHLEDLVLQRTEDLARSNRDLEQFAYVASHDLQEPLRAVAGFVGLLQQRYQGQLDEKADSYIGSAVDGVMRMQTLIGDLLSYSRVSTRGKAREPTDSGAALNRALTNLRTALEESEAVLQVDSLPTVRADATQLTQLFQNLIGNALKFRSDQPPAIQVGARREEEAWHFWIRDNGIGLEPQYAERIFLIFQRLHTRQKYPGTGIGLAICRRIVERHGGRIWVESQPGQGSTFHFTLPDKGEPV